MNYAIHVKQVPPHVVVTQRRHTSLEQLGGAMHLTLENIAAAIQPSTATRGAPFAVYHNEPFRPADVDVEMGVMVAADATVAPSRDIHRRELPGGPVAYTVHVGPYETISAAYDALYAWIDAHGHHRIGPPREIYRAGPGQGLMPQAYETEIEVPID